MRLGNLKKRVLKELIITINSFIKIPSESQEKSVESYDQKYNENAEWENLKKRVLKAGAGTVTCNITFSTESQEKSVER